MKIQSHERNVLQLTQDLRSFVNMNQDPHQSPNFSSERHDNLAILLHVVDLYFHHAIIVLLVLKSIKILSRKSVNRCHIDPSVIDVLQRIIGAYSSDCQICVEFSNIVLNICYERDNVPRVIDKGCILQLTRLMSGEFQSDYKLLSAVVGALQSICFQAEGKDSVRQSGAIRPVIQLLTCKDTTVRSRAVGVIHNLSSDLSIVPDLRIGGAIPDLIALLHDPNVNISVSAAGCIQNFSREDKSRATIRDCGGVIPLTEMLFMDHLPAQTCAAGALLNLLGPRLSSEERMHPQRVALRKLLSNCIFLGQMSDILNSAEES